MSKRRTEQEKLDDLAIKKFVRPYLWGFIAFTVYLVLLFLLFFTPMSSLINR